jgi:porin
VNIAGCESASMGTVTADKLKIAIAALVTMTLSCPALATDLSSPVNASPTPVPWLRGDWDGAWARLENAGVDFQLGYVGEIAGNTTGGLRRQAAYADQWAAGVNVDLGRLAILQGGSVQVTVTDRNGSNLSNDAGLGTLEEVQEIYGRGQTARLTRFYYNQISANGFVEWKIGRIPFSEDFAAFSCDFQNLTFCGAAAGNIVSSYIYNWPISQWASRLKLNLAGFGYFQFAVFDQNPKFLSVQHAAACVFLWIYGCFASSRARVASQI